MAEEDYDRGVREGRVDARLDGHDAHFKKINGSIDRFVLTNEALVARVESLASDIRTMKEEADRREMRVQVAAETLATETERRRKTLAEQNEKSQWKFTRRQQVSAIIVTVVLAIIGFYFAYRAIPKQYTPPAATLKVSAPTPFTS